MIGLRRNFSQEFPLPRDTATAFTGTPSEALGGVKPLPVAFAYGKSPMPVTSFSGLIYK